MIPLSARTPDQLQQQVERLQQFLYRAGADGTLPRLADLAFTLQQGREAMDYRLAFAPVRSAKCRTGWRRASRCWPGSPSRSAHRMAFMSAA
ncbi:hypothetical protein ACKZDW_23235 [Ralstonia syzygii subsp. celebesensis]